MADGYYPLLITHWGQFTCDAVTKKDFGDGVEERSCPSFDTPQEVAEWVANHETE